MAADERVRRLRLRAQRIEPRSRDGVAAVVRDVCGIQAQDGRAAALSVRARAESLTAADVAGAPDVVRVWAWRGTLHLLAVADLAWVLPLVSPPAGRSVRARWKQLGLDEDVYMRAREAIVAALHRGPRTRAELRDALAAAGIDASGQRLPHLLRRVALEGRLHHPLDDTFAALEPPSLVPREQALAELGRRYVAAYGPASERDLAKWSALPAADVREAWAAAPPSPGGETRAASVRLLPAFDTYMLGYADRDDVVAPEHAARVFPGGGWVHPVLLVDGVAAGTWKLAAGRVEAEPFAPLSAAVRDALGLEVADVERFLS